MKKWNYRVLGVMSGTSLDGIDLAVIEFRLTDIWNFKILSSELIPYSSTWVRKLSSAISLDDFQLSEFNRSYTTYLSEVIFQFKKMHPIDCAGLDAVCSHGHTIKHEPENELTLQIGNLPELATLTQETVVCDFRVQDVELGGQGAPLVPIGDELLFSDYNFCLNLGGFANISTKINSERRAFDICAVNTVLNFYSQKMGSPFDDGGKIAASGKLIPKLSEALNSLPFYEQNPPKSLGIEWVYSVVFPILKKYENDIPSLLHTYSVHIADQIVKVLDNKPESKVLITGGGAFNTFLIQKIIEKTKSEILIPSEEIINYKEAIIFGFLGVLKLRNEVNVLKSVTGAVKDHSSGKIFLP